MSKMTRTKPTKRRKPLAKVKPKKAARRLALPPDLAHLDMARAALARVLAPYAINTQRTYRIAWARWAAWCASHELTPAPIDPMRLVTHLEELAARLKPKTVRTTLSALSAIDATARGMRGDAEAHPVRAHPIVRAWLKSWARDSAGSGPRKAPPISPADLVTMLRTLGENAATAEPWTQSALLARRDRALIALGWFGAMRRSEIAALDRDDVRETPKGIEITIRRSKTDQEGEGATVAIYTQQHPEVCPFLAWRAWSRDLATLNLAGLNRHDAPAFPRVLHDGSTGLRLSGDSVGAVIERRAKAVGIAASSHSLRGGFATAAGEAGKQERDIQAHGRWKSVAVVRGYVNRGNQWNALNPTKDLT